MISFFVPGIAAPQGSKRHVGRGILVESCARLKPWRQSVGLVAAGEISRNPPAHATALRMRPCEVSLTFYFQRPKGHSGKKGLLPSAPALHATRPDIDKLARACLDAMTGTVWTDDSQVFKLDLERRYCLGDEPSGVRVRIEAH